MDKIYLRMGLLFIHAIEHIHPEDFYFNGDEESARAAKAMCLKACEIKPTSSAWLSVGRACLYLHEFEEAEDAFAVDLIYPGSKHQK
jgi:hypothetical protein